AVDCAPQVAAALTDPATVLDRSELRAVTGTAGYFPHGLPALRAAVASHLTGRLGLPAGPSQVIVTTGGQQAMDLLIRSEVLPGQPVAVEDPTFPGVPDTLFIDDMTLAELPLRDGPRPAPLAELSPRQPNLVSIGSLSKLYWGGLR